MRKVLLLFAVFITTTVSAQDYITEVLIVGGGASGTTAGIQSSRMGTKTLIIEETEWLGGMLTSAGVSAIDGNHRLPSGLWGEFRKELYTHYGGPESVETGWVSNTLFEPSVGNKILKELVAKEKNLSVLFQSQFKKASFNDGLWTVQVLNKGKIVTIESKIVIDATELGDFMAAQGVEYDVGMDSKYDTQEEYAPEEANDLVQDLTYVMILKDYGPNVNKAIKKPRGYDPHEFHGACDVSDPATYESGKNNCQEMINYAKLPNGKYMINWPKKGNDIYLNIIEMTPENREEALKEAKLHSLRFLYYIQTELGFKNLGIAKGEFPTKDDLPMIPYHRESRRVKGLVQFTLNHVMNPYDQAQALFRTGIAVGDYTIDHHHYKKPYAPEIDFVKIRVPSYTVPLGSLIPKNHDHLIVAEKSISVSNIVNGATRLQPVVLEIGQAAGILAALSVKENTTPSAIEVRKVQSILLDAKGFLLPFIDVQPEDKHFKAIQRIGATGILKGFGVPYKWANQTWFYPDRLISEYELVSGLRPFYPQLTTYWNASGDNLSVGYLIEILDMLGMTIPLKQVEEDWSTLNLSRKFNVAHALNRKEATVLIDHYLNPFSQKIDIEGNVLK